MVDLIRYIVCSLVILTMVSCTTKLTERNASQSEKSIRDSILSLLKLSKDKNSSNQIKYATSAMSLAENSRNDSLWFVALNRLSILNYRQKKFQEFKKNSKTFLTRAKELKDSLNMAKGNYKMGSFYLKTFAYDSAYYYFNNAQELFRKQNDSLKVGANLLNMAIIQTSVSDYYGSENTSIEALTYLKTNRGVKNRVAVYNNLGIISNELEQFQDAIHWYSKSLSLITKNQQTINVLNNIGIVYRNQKKYKQALSYFNKALNDSEIDNYIWAKAMLIDNIGYIHFLTKNKDALLLLEQALEIRKKEKNIRGTIVSQLHLGEFYLFNKKLVKATSIFNKALNQAVKIKDTKNTLKALSFLSKVTADEKDNYFRQYISLNDSITKHERNLKHLFAKIRYRTKEQEAKNFDLQQQNTQQSLVLIKQRNSKIIFGFTALGLSLLLISVVLYYRQKQKLQQQKNIIEKLKARTDEKQQLSMRLHDDIASDLLIGLQRSDLLQKELQHQELEQVISFFERAYNKMRKISQKISMQHFKHIPFEKKIEKLCNEYSFNADIKITYTGLKSIEWESVPIEIKSTLYSIVQEAFTNIHKHAKASIAQLDFSIHKKHLHIIISDNGRGFKVTQTDGMGLLNIKKRVTDMGGKFNISNTKPQGTLLNITIPKM